MLKKLILLVFGFSLAACASNANTQPAAELSQTNMTRAESLCNGYEGMIPIDSDNVTAACYDESTGSMFVLFDTGGLYVYHSVSPQVWDAFVAAQPNAWSEVGYPELVQSGLPYERIN